VVAVRGLAGGDFVSRRRQRGFAPGQVKPIGSEVAARMAVGLPNLAIALIVIRWLAWKRQKRGAG
jgi:hypothetical protein